MADFKRQDLEKIICDLIGISEISPMIKRQINRLVLENDMSFKEIARCLVWYVEVQKGKLSPIYGIAIAASIREPAGAYFKQLELDQQQKAKEAKKVAEYQENTIIFHIDAIQHPNKKPKLIDISSIDVKGDDNGGY